ncbi:unnamed protein product [Nippostrongylus brasiliensis]|uniref:HTH_Tnp_Tc3_1 domain-containing protein n=1 Tax=Nippostrongylus brasiliensis TaxID=27835 RepID=A0A0N4Y169_NIPBR|nr:unnamed protein product [Nippostrongylus brasiliensis]
MLIGQRRRDNRNVYEIVTPKGTKLIPLEQAHVDALHMIDLTNKKVAAQLGRSLCCINRYLKDTDAYKRKQKVVRKRKLSRRDGAFQLERPLTPPCPRWICDVNWTSYSQNERYYDA